MFSKHFATAPNRMEVVCIICCEEYNPNDSIVSLNCGHIFHEKCLTDWMKKSTNCPNCQKSCLPTKKVYVDFDTKDCTQCQQYGLLIEIKEAQIDKLKSNAQTFTEMKGKIDELKGKIANTDKLLTQKDNELAKYKQIIESLKIELNALRITNDAENVAPKNNQTEKLNNVNLLLHEKSEGMVQALAPIKK